MDAATDEKKPPTDLWSAEVPIRYHTIPIPPRLRGGDFTLVDITTECFMEHVDSEVERAMRAVHALRGVAITDEGREEWWRSLPTSLARFILKAVNEFITGASAQELPAVERDGKWWFRWTIDDKHVVELSELAFGNVDDIKGLKGVTQARMQAQLVAASAGRPIADKLLKMPAYWGAKAITIYSQIHNPTAEEEADFFGARVVSTTRPKLI